MKWFKPGLAAIVVLAAAVRLWGLSYGLPNPLARPDEEIVVGHALELSLGDIGERAAFPYPELVYFVDPVRGRQIRPDTAFAYPYPDLVYDVDAFALFAWRKANEWVGVYHSRQDFLTDLAVRRPGLQYLLCRGFGVLSGVATVLATAAAAFYAYRRRSIALVAALMVAVNFLHARDSHYATVDVPMTLGVTLSLAFALRALTTEARRDILASALFAGLAASAKFNGAGAIVSTVVAAGRRFFEPPASRRWRIVATLAIAAVVMIAGFAITSPYCVRYYRTVHLGLRQQGRVLFSTVATPAWRIFSTSTFPSAFGWPGFVAVLAGLTRAVWKRRPTDLVLLAFIVLTFSSMALMTWVLPRYPLPLLPALSIVAAEAVVLVLPSLRWMWVAPALLVLVAPPLSSIVAYDRLAARTDTRVLAADWIAAHIPPRSRVAVCRGYGAPIVNADQDQSPSFDVTRLLPCDSAGIRAAGARYVVTQTHPEIPFFIPTADASAWLGVHARPIATFNPFKGNATVGPGCFYPGDAFYLPMCGFGALERGGPIVTVWDIGAAGR